MQSSMKHDNWAGDLPARLLSKFQLFSHFFSSVRKRGVWRTLKISLFEFWYELKFGARTAYVIPTRQLDGDSEALRHATDYFPSSYLILHEAFIRGPIDCRDRILVDYGCGLGRALLFFSTLPLKKIIGVELSPSLASTAAANLQRYYTKHKKTGPEWSVINADARTFAVPDEADLFYFFNPFDASVVGAAVGNIVASVRRSPRSCTIVYANPLHAAEMTARNLTRLAWPSTDFAVFTVAADIL